MKLSNDELMKLWVFYKKHKNEDVKKILVHHYLCVVKGESIKMCKIYGKYITYAEAYSHGYHGLVNAIDNYDLSRKTDFMNYSNFRVRGCIMDALKDNKKRNIRRACILERAVEMNDCASKDRDRIVEKNIMLKEFMEVFNKAINYINEKYKKVIMMYYFDGLNQEQISKELHLSSGRISQMLKKAKTLIKQVLLRFGIDEDYLKA